MADEVDHSAIERFVELDRAGAIAGLAVVVIMNGVFVRIGAIWLIVPFLVILIGALSLARRQLRSGGLFEALALVTAGNWLVAVVVAVVLPFLWPVMAVTVLMPMVLAAPYLDRRALLATIMVGAGVAGVISGIGLLRDDSGAIPDIDDDFELVLVIGALMAQIAPIGLVVWQQNQLQRRNLARAGELNRELQQSQVRLAASRRRVVEAADTERQRIERDLHDGAQQRLVVLGIRLRLLEGESGETPAIHQAVTGLLSELDGAVDELRELAHGIYPPLLRHSGLVPALNAVARRSPLPVETSLDDIGRMEEPTETALYFTALEALTNAAKHAPDATVDLALSEVDDTIELTVVDDGPGFVVGDELRSQGANNMGDRIAAVDGDLRIESVPGQGTTVRAVVPIAPWNQDT